MTLIHLLRMVTCIAIVDITVVIFDIIIRILIVIEGALDLLPGGLLRALPRKPLAPSHQTHQVPHGPGHST